MKQVLFKLTSPQKFSSWGAEILISIPRVLCGLLLTLDFGSSKFGMPWTDAESNLALFEVAAWFPEDVAKFGIPFSLAPTLFAWLGAASEAIGGLFLALGFQTRISAFFIACTMLVAIFFQKFGQGTWAMLPAMGFLWVSIYAMVLGSGRLGLDYLLTRKNPTQVPNKLVTLGLLLCLILSLGACATHSTIGIPAQEEFLLGEGAKGSYQVSLQNLSDKQIFIKTKDRKNGTLLRELSLEPQEKTNIRISRQEFVVLQNVHKNAVKVKARISKSVEGMRYQPTSN